MTMAIANCANNLHRRDYWPHAAAPLRRNPYAALVFPHAHRSLMSVGKLFSGLARQRCQAFNENYAG
jgi:hypothetical protein